MASSFIYFNDSTTHGRILRRCLLAMETGDDLLRDIRSAMVQMRSGDGSLEAHYDEVTTFFGFQSTAKAKAAFEEIDSAYSKTSGDGAVTNVRAARDQLFDKLRG